MPGTATLNGTVTDDGFPEGITLSILWTQISGPGTTTFEAPRLNETIASFSEPGIYVLRLNATDADLSANNDITVTVHPENIAPVANAGPDQVISLPASAQLNGSAADDGWPFESTLTTNWTQIDGPGITTFAGPSATVTTACFSAPGVYLLRLTASDGELTDIDDLIVKVTPPNQPPSVSAGPDQTVTFPSSANLSGVVIDDGLPLGSSVSIAWAKISGPGDVSFEDGGAANTTAQFSVTGDYVLRLTPVMVCWSLTTNLPSAS